MADPLVIIQSVLDRDRQGLLHLEQRSPRVRPAPQPSHRSNASYASIDTASFVAVQPPAPTRVASKASSLASPPKIRLLRDASSPLVDSPRRRADPSETLKKLRDCLSFTCDDAAAPPDQNDSLAHQLLAAHRELIHILLSSNLLNQQQQQPPLQYRCLPTTAPPVTVPRDVTQAPRDPMDFPQAVRDTRDFPQALRDTRDFPLAPRDPTPAPPGKPPAIRTPPAGQPAPPAGSRSLRFADEEIHRPWTGEGYYLKIKNPQGRAAHPPSMPPGMPAGRDTQLRRRYDDEDDGRRPWEDHASHVVLLELFHLRGVTASRFSAEMLPFLRDEALLCAVDTFAEGTRLAHFRKHGARIRLFRIFSFAVPVPNSANQRHSPCLVWAEGVNCPMRDREPLFDLLAVEVSSSAELFDKYRLPDGTLRIDEPKGEPPVLPQYCFILRFSTRSLYLHAPPNIYRQALTLFQSVVLINEVSKRLLESMR
ncbi:hypothetical protein DIPPA_34577 [Diplonema papillatum]|nr:hypothetical protein DIPPA_34577 [Diplonema papillatum]